MDTKPGWKTTEFWLSIVAALLSFVFASGVLTGAADWLVQVIGLAAGALTALGYTVTRGTVKKTEAQAKSLAAAPK